MITVGVVGGTGYTGVELLRLLATHPEVELRAVTSRSEAGVVIADAVPNLRGSIELAFSAPDPEQLGECDIVFFATPNGTAMEMVPAILKAGSRVIDLAADFRLKSVADWETWYGVPHACSALLAEAVYGLPEVHRAAIQHARLVANPGCYPTAVALGAIPLVEAALTAAVIADAKSGITGAGRRPAVGSLFSETSDNFKAYGVDGHRHLPEIRQILNGVANAVVDVTFVPHLVPMLRGIHATLYIDLSDADADVQTLFAERYRAEPFVDVMTSSTHPDTRSVRGTNFCRIAVHRLGGDRIVVLSVIDNLVKGAAGQAIQNMNIMCDLDETTGLRAIAVVP